MRLAFSRDRARCDEKLALFAVGGFGRGELFPHSDVDLMFLHQPETPPNALAAIVGPLTQHLWDIGLEPSHSVRSLRDISRFQAENTELYLSLLDARPLCGDADLIEQFWDARRQLLRTKRVRLVERLFDLLDGRWRQFDFTIHHLEPDIKDGPGGLRDMHVLRWLAFLKEESPFWNEPERWPRAEKEIQQHLGALRCFLHFQEGRNQNVLRFDAQEEWIDLLARRGVDATDWTRRHYQQARSLQWELKQWTERFSHPATALQRGIEQWRARLSNADFLVSRGVVHLKSPGLLTAEPELGMKLFAFLARHGLDPAEDTLRRLREVAPAFAENMSGHPAERAGGRAATQNLPGELTEIFSRPYANVAARAMDVSGYLAAIFPEWNDIDCLLVRDYYHRYTVDEHTLVCVDALCELLRGQKDLDARILDLAAQSDARAALVLALLFHDIGKKDGVEGHAERSRDIAAVALERVGFPDEVITSVTLLAEQHLLLSHAMRTRDLADPATGTEIAGVCGTHAMLRMLTLVTYADIRGVFPGALTPWRMDQLWSAYRIAQLSIEDTVARERILPAGHYSPAELRYLQGFSTRYTRLFLPAQLRDHFGLHRALERGESGLKLRKVEANFEMIAVCRDASMLFAEVTALLAGMRLNILQADAFRNDQGLLLLRFRFDDPGRSLTLNPSDQDRLKERLEQVLYHGKPAVAALARRGHPRLSRGQKLIEPYVYARNDVSPTLTMFEIGAADRPGLLYDIARTFAENDCTIDVLIVETRAHRAFDTLYVQKGGHELSSEEQAVVTQSLLSVLRAAR